MKYLEKFYTKEFKSVADKYSKLKLYFRNNKWGLEGKVDIIDDKGKEWDTYEIKIVFPHNYPKSIPILYEVGGRLKLLPEFHVNKDGSCCLAPAAMEMAILKGKITIIDYMEELVIPYLANQTYREKTGKYANGEFGHGALGIYEFYQGLFNTKSISFIITVLQKIVNKDLPSRNDSCFCKSGKKYKKCHLKSIQYLSPVNNDILNKDCKTLLDGVNAILSKNTRE